MELNDDVVTEILLRLPVKSVLRLKSVCKSWCKIIDSSAFRKTHFHNHHSRSNNIIEKDDVLFLQFKETTWTLSSSLFPHNWKSYNHFPPAFQKFLVDNIRSRSGRWEEDHSIIFDGPINGLICMYNLTPVEHQGLEWSLSIAICNPCLGEIKFLPSSPACTSLLDSLVGTEIWVQAFASRNIGFGFDFLTQDYKLVQLIWSLDGRCMHVEVYSGRTNTWRELVADIFDDVGTCYNEIDVIKSSCKRSGTKAYWQILKLTGNGDYMESLILSFDMQNEVFERFRLPEFYHPGFLGLEHTTVFAKDDESLVLFVNTWFYRRLEIWELDKERSWTHVRNIYDPQFEQVNPWPIALWKDGVVLRCHFPQDHNLFTYWFMYDEEERKCFELSRDRLEILEYKCTLYSLFGDIAS